MGGGLLLYSLTYVGQWIDLRRIATTIKKVLKSRGFSTVSSPILTAPTRAIRTSPRRLQTLSTTPTAFDLEGSVVSHEQLPQGVSTRAVHGGERQQRLGDAVTVPVYQTSTYVFRNTQELVDFKEGRIEKGEYGRYGNPTINAAERKIAELEHADDALLWASGMCTITSMLLSMLRAGQHMIITADSYRRTRQFCDGMLRRLGIEVTVVPPGGLGAIE